jgi:hypothetical protein
MINCNACARIDYDLVKASLIMMRDRPAKLAIGDTYSSPVCMSHQYRSSTAVVGDNFKRHNSDVDIDIDLLLTYGSIASSSAQWSPLKLTIRDTVPSVSINQTPAEPVWATAQAEAIHGVQVWGARQATRCRKPHT